MTIDAWYRTWCTCEYTSDCKVFVHIDKDETEDSKSVGRERSAIADGLRLHRVVMKQTIKCNNGFILTQGDEYQTLIIVYSTAKVYVEVHPLGFNPKVVSFQLKQRITPECKLSNTLEPNILKSMKRLTRADSHVKLQSMACKDRNMWTLEKHNTHDDDTFKSFAYDMYNCKIELFDECVVPCEYTAVNVNGVAMWILPDIETHDCNHRDYEGIAYEVEAFTE
jgi:hypothetical protein